MSSLDELLAGRRTDIRPRLMAKKLPRSCVAHTPLDDLALGISRIESPGFRELTMDEPPIIPASAVQPEEPDFATATPEEIEVYQKGAQAARQALDEGEPYDGWEDFTGDMHHALHTEGELQVTDEVDTSVKLHPKLVRKVTSTQAFAETLKYTRGDRTMTEVALKGMVKELRELVEDQLVDQVREQEEIEKRRKEAEQAQEELEDLPVPPEDVPGGDDPAGTMGPGGTVGPGGEAQPEPDDSSLPVGGEGEPTAGDPALEQRRKELEEARDRALDEAQEIEDNATPIDSGAMDALRQAAEAARDAAEASSHAPKFGAGKGAGEPVYSSPEQALAIAERWGQDRKLRQIGELFGQLDPAQRFLRATRAEGGADEIVDIEFGDNLKRVLPQELALLSDGETEDIFYQRYTSQELAQFATIGEATAGRGPVIVVLDGSESMTWNGGKRNIWARAEALCLLHLTRLDKRDYYVIEFSSANQVKEWSFPAKKPLDGEDVIDMASHIFSGGTSPVLGVHRAHEVMQKAAEFKKADIVIVGDGDSRFGPEDEKLRDQLRELGVRLFGVAVGPELGDSSYLHHYCEHVVKVQDFDLEAPSDATAQLATHLT